MSVASKNQRRLGLALATLLHCCLATPAFSDEAQFLPDHSQVIASIDLETSMKTKTYPEATWLLPKGNYQLNDPLDLGLAKIARLTGAWNMPKEAGQVEAVTVYTTIKPISAAEVKALTKKSLKKFGYREIKVGSITAYQETYFEPQFDDQGRPAADKLVEGLAFFVAGEKHIVTSNQMSALKRILERNKAAELSPAMRAGLKEADFSNAVNLVVDYQGLPARERNGFVSLFMLFNHADMKANAAKLQTVTMRVNARDKLKMSITLICNDPAGAGAIKGIVNRNLEGFRDLLKGSDWVLRQVGPLPSESEYEKIATATHAMLGAMQVSTSVNNVTASAELEPGIAARGIYGFFGITRREKP